MIYWMTQNLNSLGHAGNSFTRPDVTSLEKERSEQDNLKHSICHVFNFVGWIDLINDNVLPMYKEEQNKPLVCPLMM